MDGLPQEVGAGDTAGVGEVVSTSGTGGAAGECNAAGAAAAAGAGCSGGVIDMADVEGILGAERSMCVVGVGGNATCSRRVMGRGGLWAMEGGRGGGWQLVGSNLMRGVAQVRRHAGRGEGGRCSGGGLQWWDELLSGGRWGFEG